MSQPVQPIHTFRDPAMSLWQSALHKAITRRAAAAAGVASGAAARGLGASASDPHMMATVAAGAFVRGARPAAVSTASAGGTLETCASLYARLAVAKFEGNQAEVTSLENEIQFSVCDPLWAEALVDYEE